MKRILILFYLSLILSACGNKADVGRARDNSGASPKITINSCQGNQLLARVLAPSGSDLRPAAGALVSATMDPSGLGQISGAATGTTGVELQLTVATDETKQIISRTSQFRLVIRDSYVGQKTTDGRLIQPIEIVHTAQSQLTGSWDSNQKLLKVTFSDNYGEIHIEGHLEGSTLNGLITFKNSTSWNGATPSAGTLGSFQTQAGSCGF